VITKQTFEKGFEIIFLDFPVSLSNMTKMTWMSITNVIYLINVHYSLFLESTHFDVTTSGSLDSGITRNATFNLVTSSYSSLDSTTSTHAYSNDETDFDYDVPPERYSEYCEQEPVCETRPATSTGFEMKSCCSGS